MLFVLCQEPIKKLITTERKEEYIAGSLNRINMTIRLLKKKGNGVKMKIKNEILKQNQVMKIGTIMRELQQKGEKSWKGEGEASRNMRRVFQI
jgi:hypothetical protein